VGNSSGVIQPYLDIARQYGCANYVFQTNQGPSFPAHQFLISGTSAPDAKAVPLYSYFALDNPSIFRVPLLVVSEWVKNDSAPGGHISNPYYDFGSILKFIEETYGITSDIYPAYEYADYFAGQRFTNGAESDLSDFFCFPPTCQTPPHATFQQIGLYNNSHVCSTSICGSNNCDAKCFINYPGSPNDPDTY
jgi:hypothetical protein